MKNETKINKIEMRELENSIINEKLIWVLFNENNKQKINFFTKA